MPIVLDENPQFLRGYLLETAANTFTELKIGTGIPYTVAKGKSVVMEIHRVFFERAPGDSLANDAMKMCVCSKKQSSMPLISDDGVIAKWNVVGIGASPTYLDLTKQIDLTDGRGDGVLVGSKDLFCYLQGESQTAATFVAIAVEYTLKEVDTEELIGMIQGD